VPDSPSTARFLSHEERVIAVHRIAENMIGVKTREFKMHQAIEAVLDVKVWCLILIGIATGTINGGVTNFASSLFKGYGFTGFHATLLQMPTGAVELFVVPVCGYIASRYRNMRCIVTVVICLVPLGGLLGIRLTSLEHKWTLVGISSVSCMDDHTIDENLLGCTWLQYLIGAPVIIAWNIMQSNIAGHTKRSVTSGMWFVFYAAGGIAGPNIFFAKQAPR
jgi:hypothetical protein